ncbi:MAG: NAD(P)H-dependent flavin oxidoreductase [Burkholderiales bacterium]
MANQQMRSPSERSELFCKQLGLRYPILLGPMAGVPAPALSVAVAKAGGLGACGALLMQPEAIHQWAAQVRAQTTAPFQLNLWIPDPPPLRDAAHEARWREWLSPWGPTVPLDAGDATPPNFEAQCQALLTLKPAAVSSVMGLFPPSFVQQLKAAGIYWLANVSTVLEAQAAQAAGADAIVAQGMEAGGHRACFDAARAEAQQVGLMALLPAVVDAVELPVVATGGIADARGVAAAFALGASAVQIGTGFLRTPEAGILTAWADALAQAWPEDTTLTRAFSGRAGRSLVTDYVRAVSAADAPHPAPYPVQRGLTQAMRSQAASRNELRGMQAWAGQSARLALALPAVEVFERLCQGCPK